MQILCEFMSNKVLIDVCRDFDSTISIVKAKGERINPILLHSHVRSTVLIHHTLNGFDRDISYLVFLMLTIKY